MNLTIVLESLQEDLQGAAELGDDRVAAVARRLSDVIGSSLRLKLFDLLSQAAAELSSKLPSGHVEVRLAGQEPEFVYVETAGGDAGVSDDAGLPDDAGLAADGGPGGRGGPHTDGGCGCTAPAHGDDASEASLLCLVVAAGVSRAWRSRRASGSAPRR